MKGLNVSIIALVAALAVPAQLGNVNYEGSASVGLVLFTVIGLMVINPKHAYPLAVMTKQPPSLKYPFGTDFFGRDMMAAMVPTILTRATYFDSINNGPEGCPLN